MYDFRSGSAKEEQPVAAPPPSCFNSKQRMIEAAGLEGLVCLHFAASKDKAKLYAHRSFLRCCFGVFRTLLDEDSALVCVPDQQPAKVVKLQAGSSPAACSSSAAAAAAAAANDSLPVVPVTDEDTTAWEEALALMYPMLPGLQISWDNAKRLLLLAAKYDAPFITERVRSFFTAVKSRLPYFFSGTSTELRFGLTPSTAFDWLLLFSKCGVDDLADICIAYMAAHASAVLPAAFCSSGLQLKHVEQLCQGLQQQKAALQQQKAALQQQVASQQHELAESKVPRTGRSLPVIGSATAVTRSGTRSLAAWRLHRTASSAGLERGKACASICHERCRGQHLRQRCRGVCTLPAASGCSKYATKSTSRGLLLFPLHDMLCFWCTGHCHELVMPAWSKPHQGRAICLSWQQACSKHVGISYPAIDGGTPADQHRLACLPRGYSTACCSDQQQTLLSVCLAVSQYTC